MKFKETNGSGRKPAAFAVTAGERVGSMKIDFLLDSGANEHMCPNKDMFSQLTLFGKERNISIHVASGKGPTALGIGTVDVIVKDSHGAQMPVTLRKVLFVPGITSNLLSTNRLTGQGDGNPTGHSYVSGPTGARIILDKDVVIPLNFASGLSWMPVEEVGH